MIKTVPEITLQIVVLVFDLSVSAGIYGDRDY